MKRIRIKLYKQCIDVDKCPRYYYQAAHTFIYYIYILKYGLTNNPSIIYMNKHQYANTFI